MGDELPRHFSASIFIFSSDLAFEIWSVSTARPPATQEAHKHQSKQHTRCSAVSPAAQTDEKTADTSLTTSPGWDTFQPPELNQAPVEAAFGYFISSPSPYSLEVRLIYLTRMSAKSHFESNVTFVVVVYIAAARLGSFQHGGASFWANNGYKDHRIRSASSHCIQRQCLVPVCWCHSYIHHTFSSTTISTEQDVLTRILVPV